MSAGGSLMVVQMRKGRVMREPFNPRVFYAVPIILFSFFVYILSVFGWHDQGKRRTCFA
jgi:hypothetical protein